MDADYESGAPHPIDPTLNVGIRTNSLSGVIAASVFRHAYLSTEVNARQKRIVLRSHYGTYAQLTGFFYPFSYWLLQTQELSLASVCLRSFP